MFDWGNRPAFAEFTPLTLDAEGGISGHLIRDDGYGPSQPMLRAYLRSFHRIPILAAPSKGFRAGLLGTKLVTAPVTLSLRESLRFYAVAPTCGYIRVYRDRHGLALHGTTHEPPRAEDVGPLMVSGDWRRRRGEGMSLVGLSIARPVGYSVPR